MPVSIVDQIFGPKGTEEEVTLPFSLYSGELRHPSLPLTLEVQESELRNTRR